MTSTWKNATYACINLGEAFAPTDIEQKSICINDDIGNVVEQLLEKKDERFRYA
jgi:hypothetical protein